MSSHVFDQVDEDGLLVSLCEHLPSLGLVLSLPARPSQNRTGSPLPSSCHVLGLFPAAPEDPRVPEQLPLQVPGSSASPPPPVLHREWGLA